MTDSNNILLPEPLAYFLTWPTYGTWLPGDRRGWVRYQRGFHVADSVKELEAEARMAEDACHLSENERRIVEAVIADHCSVRRWPLHAVNCRSNHVHVVLTASEHPDEVRDQLKAWCTRKLKEHQRSQISAGLHQASAVRERWWAARGSQRYINDLDSLEAAVRYARDAQGTSRWETR